MARQNSSVALVAPPGGKADRRQEIGEGGVLGDQGLKISFALKRELLLVLHRQLYRIGQGHDLVGGDPHGRGLGAVDHLAIGRDLPVLVGRAARRQERGADECES